MKFYTFSGVLSELDNFSLEELLEVKEKIDKLIQSKTSNTTIEGPFSRATFDTLGHNIVVSSVKQENSNQDMQALDSMIALVSEWLKDDSEDDELVYPKIKAALIQD
jgi:hypothetical protein